MPPPSLSGRVGTPSICQLEVRSGAPGRGNGLDFILRPCHRVAAVVVEWRDGLSGADRRARFAPTRGGGRDHLRRFRTGPGWRSQRGFMGAFSVVAVPSRRSWSPDAASAPLDLGDGLADTPGEDGGREVRVIGGGPHAITDLASSVWKPARWIFRATDWCSPRTRSARDYDVALDPESGRR